MNTNEKLQPITIDSIKSKIYEIRGQRVMLDRDLAELYQVETRVLNQAVKRNLQRFPKDFMFQLSEEEWMSSQIVTTSAKKRPKVALPFAFTEYGVIMLASTLRSNIAVQVSIFITRAFIALRQAYISTQKHDIRLEKIEHKLDNLSNYIEETLQTQNDINDDTATQL